MKTKKLGQTNFIGSPEALRASAKKKIKAYKKGVAVYTKNAKAMKAERLAKIKSVKVKYI